MAEVAPFVSRMLVDDLSQEHRLHILKKLSLEFET